MNKGQFRVRKRTQKDYTLYFKLKVVEEVESGERSQHADYRKYGIKARFYDIIQPGIPATLHKNYLALRILMSMLEISLIHWVYIKTV